jgi:capsular polysaccharide biosynthesis protein
MIYPRDEWNIFFAIATFIVSAYVQIRRAPVSTNKFLNVIFAAVTSVVIAIAVYFLSYLTRKY